MNELRFYTDTHIAKAVAIQLRSQGVDIVRCEEVGLAAAKDIEHLTYATTQKRMLITSQRPPAKAGSLQKLMLTSLSHAEGLWLRYR